MWHDDFLDQLPHPVVDLVNNYRQHLTYAEHSSPCTWPATSCHQHHPLPPPSHLRHSDATQFHPNFLPPTASTPLRATDPASNLGRHLPSHGDHSCHSDAPIPPHTNHQQHTCPNRHSLSATLSSLFTPHSRPFSRQHHLSQQATQLLTEYTDLIPGPVVPSLLRQHCPVATSTTPLEEHPGEAAPRHHHAPTVAHDKKHQFTFPATHSSDPSQAALSSILRPPPAFQPHQPLPVFGAPSPTQPPRDSPCRGRHQPTTPHHHIHLQHRWPTANTSHPTAASSTPIPQSSPPVLLQQPRYPQNYDTQGRAIPLHQQVYDPETDPGRATHAAFTYRPKTVAPTCGLSTSPFLDNSLN